MNTTIAISSIALGINVFSWIFGGICVIWGLWKTLQDKSRRHLLTALYIAVFTIIDFKAVVMVKMMMLSTSFAAGTATAIVCAGISLSFLALRSKPGRKWLVSKLNEKFQ